ncbi:hemicentin-2-like [Crassostrea angulata]|uniref:hemicentin-2-like n=1 Tax=Magallana angulata TaxID=2784310 RepID=UPI0022B1FD46|nr:hemicentin-2-like [Crassostrea angulata]
MFGGRNLEPFTIMTDVQLVTTFCFLGGICVICLGRVYGQELNGDTQSLSVIEGGEITLPCTAHNITDQKVFWFQKEGFPLFVLNESYTADDRFELVRSSDDDWGLRIHDVREDDAGIYRCLLNTNPVQLKTLYLDVLVPANINKTLSSTTVSASEGEDVDLYCDVRGNPKPLVSWIRKGEYFAAGKNLSLHDVTCDTAGTYTCAASNHVGEAVYHNFQLSICTNAANVSFGGKGAVYLTFFTCLLFNSHFTSLKFLS